VSRLVEITYTIWELNLPNLYRKRRILE
jgi:hypothetical protein